MTGWNDERVERVIGILLRAGVLLSAAVVFAGGVFYLARNGGERAAFQTFHSLPPSYRGVSGIAQSAARLDSAAIIQFGLLLLIATPVARVAFSIVAFALERDKTYVLISAIVFCILIFSLTYAQ